MKVALEAERITGELPGKRVLTAEASGTRMRRNWCLVEFLLAAVVILMISVTALLPTERSFIDLSIVVRAPKFSSVAKYDWGNGHQVIYPVQDEAGNNKLAVFDRSNRGYHEYRIPRPGIGAHLYLPPSVKSSGTGSIALLLGPKQSPVYWALPASESTWREVTSAATYSYDFAWSAEGPTWVALEERRNGLYVCEYAFTGLVRKTAAPQSHSSILAVPSKDEVITADFEGACTRQTIVVSRWKIDRPPAILGTYEIGSPEPADLWLVKASPSGNQLAQIVRFRRMSLLGTILSGIGLSWVAKDSSFTGLWISNIDGSARRMICIVAGKGGNDEPWNLEWTKDGKHLSFTYRRKLHLVPVM
jgi:hypothetical protein